MTKDEAFRQFIKENKPFYIWNDNITKAFNAGWQSAKQQSAGEIAELKKKLERKEIADKSYALAITEAIIEKDMTINALKADNVIMRDALNKIALGYVYDADIIESAGDCLQRLSATPSQTNKGE